MVSKKSGHIFEKRLLEKYLTAEGKCPVTGEEMTMDDVVELQAPKAVKPRPASASSIPGILKMFQDEWDALMLETHTLKTNLDTARQELVKTLYQHDAACRVIARLVTERDEARHMLTQFQGQQATQAATPAAATDGGMDVDEPGGFPAEVDAAMEAKFQELQAARKGRKAPPTLATPEALGSYVETATAPLHATTKAGIKAMCVDPKDSNMIITGGQDGGVILFDKTAGKIKKTIKAHSKPVTSVCAHPSAAVVFSTSADKTVKVWRGSADDGFDKGTALKMHSKEVSGLSVHPTGKYICTSSADGSWTFTDIETGKSLLQIEEGSAAGGYSAISVHPDGLLCGVAGKNGTIQVYDIRKSSVVATLPGHNDAVNSLAFSENGYYAASGGADGNAVAWDLRKLNKNNGIVKQFECGSPVNSVAFDYSGAYLAVASDQVQVFKSKKWNLLATYEGHSKAVSAVEWGPDAGWLASASMDRNLRIWSAK